MERNRLTDEGGFALVAALILAVAVIALGILGAHKSGIELTIAANGLMAQQAMSLGEAGVEHAYSLIKADADGFADELSVNGTGGALAAIGSVVSLEGRNYRFHQTGSSAEGYYVRAVDNYDEQIGADDAGVDVDSRIRIIAMGRVQEAFRTVELAVRSKPLFPYTAWAKEFINFSGGGISDSFNSDSGPYDPMTAGSVGDIYSDGTITLSSSSTINGDGTAVSTITLSGSAAITGTATEFADPLDLPSTPACGPPYEPDASRMSGIGAWSYNPATGMLSGSGGAAITLDDGDYCIDEVSLSGGSTLNVNGPVTLSVTGKFNTSGGGLVNTTNAAANFLIFVSGPDDVTVSGGGNAYFAIYARDSKITFSGGSHLYGAFVGKSITNSGGSSFHFDQALNKVADPNELERLVWREVKNP